MITNIEINLAFDDLISLNIDLLYAFLLKDISDIESCYVLWFPFKKYKLYGDGILTGMIKTLSLPFISYWQLR